MKPRLVIAAAIGMSLAGGFSAQAGHEVKLDGCVGFYEACLVVWSGGRAYNVTWAFPRPFPGSYVHVEGTATGPGVICRGVTNLFPAMALAKPGYCSKGKRKGY